jgi:hypothetical protein
MTDNIEKLGRYEMVNLLRFFLHQMGPDQRFRLMAEQPLTYGKLVPAATHSVVVEVATRLHVGVKVSDID